MSRRSHGEPAPRVLVVDDEAPQREIIAAILSGEGWNVDTADSAKLALRKVEDNTPQVVLTDLRMQHTDGLELLGELQRRLPHVPVILMTAHGTVETAVQAMKSGAFDYLTKPLARDELLLTVERALERARLVEENRELKEALAQQRSRKNLIGEHGAMREVLRLVGKVAASNSTVLLWGETGTGKEVIARTIHQESKKKDGPLVAINCSAIPEQLLESELFGYERGAFTGANQQKLGLIERANGGTLFLDEIGDLPISLQPKLLRVLQERELVRVGGERPLPIDVRVIAATHRDLARQVELQEFREDLYWRLNVFPIKLPPLRERATDVPLLSEHFLTRLAEEAGGPPKRLAPAALEVLTRYAWPGNVRQLQSVLERAALLADGGEIELGDLPVEVKAPAGKLQLGGPLELHLPDEGFVFEELERQILAQAMERSGHVIAKAAKMLGMTYRTLQYRLEKFGLRGT